MKCNAIYKQPQPKHAKRDEKLFVGHFCRLLHILSLSREQLCLNNMNVTDMTSAHLTVSFRVLTLTSVDLAMKRLTQQKIA